MKNEDNKLVQVEKKELKDREEKTQNGKWYVPRTDIFETDNELYVRMDMPGVKKSDIGVNVEKNVLSVEGTIDPAPYREMEPAFTEYNIGNFTRKFSLSNQINQEDIRAEIKDGVLLLVLPKIPEAQPRKIAIS